ncbi:LuxR C-terminal-related transcriptional regulator [Actinocrispum sp. NPDC049592]|uniref:response regulator transcription factor n=1 Tax=Actinocrispum sp. NPDC049592 TaxID=3154835 RepID=UPI00344303C0
MLALVGEGLANREISRALHVAAGTVKTHIRGLLSKLDARDRVRLVLIAHRAGLVASWGRPGSGP